MTVGQLEKIGSVFLSYLRTGRLTDSQVDYLVSNRAIAMYFDAMVRFLHSGVAQR